MSGVTNPAFVTVDEKAAGIDELTLEEDIDWKNGVLTTSADIDHANTKDDIEPSSDPVCKAIVKFWENIELFKLQNEKRIKLAINLITNAALILYVAAVIYHWHGLESASIQWCDGHGMVFIIISLIFWSLTYYNVIKPILWTAVSRNFSLSTYRRKQVKQIWRVVRTLIYMLAVIALAIFLAIDTAGNRRRLISLCGICVFVGLGFIFSKHPGHVKWSTVLMGLSVQMVMGLLAIRWTVGRQIFQCIGERVEAFLNYAYVGASFVYGDFLIGQNVFAFKAMSVIFFLGMVVQIMFYYGWMQTFCFKLGWLVQIMMGTTVIESVNAVSSVFLGMSEAPMLYKPYIKDLTASEVHAVMAGGFSTVAGTMFAAYISLGINPSNIITAAIMTAPAALCYAKLLYPENKKSRTSANNFEIYLSEDSSVMDAACKGALVGVEIVLGIIASVIACVSFIAFLNGILLWLGNMAGVDNLSFETILGKVFIPLAWLMGVEPDQCEVVARLIGIKTTVNELIAYKELGALKRAGQLSPRSEAIATFSLCGFANPGSVGTMIATLTSLCHSQRANITDVAFRAFISGTVTCFLTACIAGILMPEEGFTGHPVPHTNINGSI